MPDQTPSPGFVAQVNRVWPSLLLTAIVAFGTSWWNSQLTQNDLRYRLDRLEEKQRETSQAAATAAQAAQQNAIRMAELGIIQANVVEQLKDIKAEHERLMRK